MFGITEAEVIAWFVAKAYEPAFIYSAIILLMYASSFGLPLPEEVPLISAGLVGHVAMHPDLYPPPPSGGEPVNLYVLAAVCFFAVFTSDLLIYSLGKFAGQPLLKRPRFKKLVESKNFRRVQTWTQKYGFWASGIFRFTPGLRFPGHFACGTMGVPIWKFIAVDGGAALISVPTQILLVGYYGDVILNNFKPIKMVLFGVLAVVIAVTVWKKLPQWREGFKSE
jgi:membrane protein DedA with SNARE-associated domain